MNFDPLKTIPNLTPHTFVDNELWGSSGYQVVNVSAAGVRSVFGTVPVSEGEVGAARSPLFGRLARLGISNVTVTPSGTVIAIASRRIWRLARSRSPGPFLQVGRVERGRRPLQRGLCSTTDGKIFWGEYFGNGQRDAVRIFGSDDDGETFEEAFSFSAGTVRHIHAIQEDSYTGDLWILAGDDGQEARMFRARVKGRKLDQLAHIGGGAQIWRAVSVVFQKDFVYWGTDAPDTRNKIVRYSRKTRELSILKVVSGPVYYSAQTTDGILCFGTSVETNCRPAGRAEIWASSNGNDFSLQAEFEKDAASVRLFQFGVLNIPTGSHPPGLLCFSATALQLPYETTIFTDVSRS